MQTHRTIVVLDDQANNRLLPGLILRPFGFEVFECASGQEAIALLANIRVDAVLLDIDMPGLSGLALLPAIKQSPQLRHVKVIACTVNATHLETPNPMSQGCDAVLLKPIKSFDLVKILIK